MMAVEGPYLAAVVARLPDPTLGLAAYGVAIALAVLMEAPVIMLLSASTALVEDAVSYRRLRTFAHGLNAFSTLMLLAVLVPPVHRGLMLGVLGLPEELARLTYGALWCFLPWPAAIGYRRFWQGVLIRSGRTRLVAGGTVVRLVSMSVAALALAIATDLPGAAVGASALSFGVVMEAAVARWMARDAIRALLVPTGRGADAADPVTVSSDPHDIAEIGRVGVSTADPASGAGTGGGELGFGDIGRFYVPLMLTSLIGIAIQPMLTFFMGRAASPVESLAVFPVVHSLGFIFRSVGLSFQDAVIALLGRRNEGYEEIRRFAIGLGATLSGILALLAFTPLSQLWFVHVSGLTPELGLLRDSGGAGAHSLSPSWASFSRCSGHADPAPDDGADHRRDRRGDHGRGHRVRRGRLGAGLGRGDRRLHRLSAGPSDRQYLSDAQGAGGEA